VEIGAKYLRDGRCRFVLWAPIPKDVSLRIVFPQERIVPLKKDESGCWSVEVENVAPGTLYFYRLNGSRDLPDPASFFQPQDVHGPSQVIDHSSFRWRDHSRPDTPLQKMIIYELHVGTFTPQGTFQSILPRLDDLCDLGINALEIMPVAQFPGKRNWGYDGAYPFSVQNSYGGPEGLKQLVFEAHRRGMAVILDVVYNHLGPEGSYLAEYGPYFTQKYQTPWGKAINFDDLSCAEVRNFFVENALNWFENYHIDALRIDAIHGIFDSSEKHILRELSEKTGEFSKKRGRRFYLIAESDLNEERVIRPRELEGYGIDAQWNDDFHHCLHTLLTGEKNGYYKDFGRIENLVKAMKEGFVYSGQYSQYRKKDHGTSSKDRAAKQFVVFSQNHDQVGNRMLGERLSSLVSFEALKLAAGAVLLSPYIPLLFMGEEYGEEVPFLYFVSYSDPKLVKTVSEERIKAFAAFSWRGKPPDPESNDTFLVSKLGWQKRKQGKHKALLDFYRRLIQIRKNIPALSILDKNNLEVWGNEKERFMFWRRWYNGSSVCCVMNFNKEKIRLKVDIPEGKWKKVMDSSEKAWMGPGSLLPLNMSPLSFALYEKVE
jgi:maltooligosyltrehalose trehalohydrolase